MWLEQMKVHILSSIPMKQTNKQRAKYQIQSGPTCHSIQNYFKMFFLYKKKEEKKA
jgi:hypothetical protein